jgi:hypothetical protein
MELPPCLTIHHSGGAQKQAESARSEQLYLAMFQTDAGADGESWAKLAS